MLKRASWFSFDLSIKKILKRMSYAEVGEVIMLALDAFENGEVPESESLTDMQSLALDTLIEAIADANVAYQKKVESGRRGGRAKAANRRNEMPKDNDDSFLNIPDDLESIIPFGEDA